MTIKWLAVGQLTTLKTFLYRISTVGLMFIVRPLVIKWRFSLKKSICSGGSLINFCCIFTDSACRNFTTYQPNVRFNPNSSESKFIFTSVKTGCLCVGAHMKLEYSLIQFLFLELRSSPLTYPKST